jgi:hypothetical protein
MPANVDLFIINSSTNGNPVKELYPEREVRNQKQRTPPSSASFAELRFTVARKPTAGEAGVGEAFK